MVEKVGDVHSSTGILISLPLFLLLLILQSCVIGHFLYKIRGREISRKIKFATLSVLFIGWFGICFEAITILLNLSFSFATQNGYCWTVIWFRYNYFLIFEFTLYIFWMIRIYHTFKFSVFEIKLRYIIIIAFIVFIICIIFIILTTISMSEPQYKEISISLSLSSSHENGFDCIPKWSIYGILTVYIIEQIVTLILNVFFASLFFYKLHKLQDIAKYDGGKGGHFRSLRIFQLMQKHTLLALLSVFTSIICCLLFDSLSISLSHAIIHDMLVILSIDRVVKSLCIILMYKFYENTFSKICCCCLKCTHSKCVSSKIHQMFPYFDPNPDAELVQHTIYAQCHNIQYVEDIYGEDISINQSEIEELENIEITSISPISAISPISPSPNRALPKYPDNLQVNTSKNSIISNSTMSIGCHRRELSKSKSKSYSKALPQIDFSTNPYTMCNFIACLTNPQNSKLRYLNYSNKGYNIIPTAIFNQIHEKSQQNQGVVILDGFQFNENKFSFLQKTKCLYPYKLAIRLKNHHQHIDDAYKLLKYAEYKLNEAFKSISSNNLFQYEPYFDRIARDLTSGKLIKYGANSNFMTFDGSAQHFAIQTPSIQVSWSRQESRDQLQINNKPLPPITPIQSVDI